MSRTIIYDRNGNLWQGKKTYYEFSKDSKGYYELDEAYEVKDEDVVINLNELQSKMPNTFTLLQVVNLLYEIGGGGTREPLIDDNDFEKFGKIYKSSEKFWLNIELDLTKVVNPPEFDSDKDSLYRLIPTPNKHGGFDYNSDGKIDMEFKEGESIWI